MYKRIGKYLVLIMNLIIINTVYAGSETKITGYTSLAYQESFPGNSSDNNWSQSLSLRWIDQLYRNKITLGLDLQLTKTNSENMQIRPTWSMNVRGYQYTLTMNYIEYRDSDYQGGQSTLITKSDSINLILTPPDLPRITLNYTGNRYMDDQTYHAVNSKTENMTIKGDYQLSDLSLSASHTQNTFWSKPEVENTQSFAGLIALSIDPTGYVYTLSNVDYQIQVFTSSGSQVRQWGSFGSAPSQFTDPIGIVVDNSGYVYVTDAQLHLVKKFSSTGNYITQWGGFGSGNGLFNSPNGIAVDNSGYIYVVDQGNNRIQKFTSAGSFITSWGMTGTGDGDFSSPVGIVIDKNNNVYVTDAGNHRVEKFDTNGDYIAQWGSFGSNDGLFNNPTGITIDNQGYVYVMDYGNGRIQRFNTTGIFVSKWNTHGSQSGNCIHINPSVQIYEANLQNGLVDIFSSTGAYITSFGSFITITSNESHYKITSDQFAINYGFHPSEYIDLNMGYNVTHSVRQGTSMATTDSLYQQYSFGWQMNPLRVASIYGSHYWVLSESKVNHIQNQDSQNISHELGLTLRPFDDTNITMGYNRSEYTEDSTSNTRSESESVSVTSKLYSDLMLNQNYSHSETFSMDTKTSTSDQISLTLSAQLLPDAAADLIMSHSQSKNLEDGSKSDNGSYGLRWRSQPTEKILWNETVQYTQAKSISISDSTTSTSKSSQIDYTTELNYWMRSSFNIFMNGTYSQRFENSDNLTYSAGFTWRPKNSFYMTNTFSQTLGETDSSTFNTTLEFQFRHQVQMSLGYRYYNQQDNGSTQTVFARLTKSF